MIAAVLLAAGGSSRMGRAKQSLSLRGRSLLRSAAEAVGGAGCDPVVVVLGADAARLGEELAGLSVSVAINERWSEGIAGSIRRGLKAVLASTPDAEALLLAPCDQPHLNAGIVRRMREAYDGRPDCRVACEYAGTVGTPALLGSAWFDRLARLEGDRGAKSLLLEAAEDLVRVSWPQGAIDIDRPEDYEALLRGDITDADL